MPHADIKYSSDLNIDTAAIFKAIEKIIKDHDPSTGVCKGRAYPTDQYQHTHALFEVSLLPKAHRDKAFTDTLLAELERVIKAQLSQPCGFSLQLSYNPDSYVTNKFAGS